MKKIKIDSRVIKHLGKDLITTSDVAVIELVKNAIDAKARNIKLQIYDEVTSDLGLPEEAFNHWISDELKQQPILIVDDNGHGMTDGALDEGFLTVGTAIKESDGSLLGAKGIGRLATQRLGKALLLETSSDFEDHMSYVYIDWGKVISGQMDVPSMVTEKTYSHTRLWIFGIRLDDYIENAVQFYQRSLLPEAYEIYINRDLKSALNFLISPFSECDSKISKINISLYYREQIVDIEFPSETLGLAESRHNFSLNIEDSKLILSYNVDLKPWYAERVHRAIVKTVAFERLRQPHEYYDQLLKTNSERLNATLNLSASESDLQEHYINLFKDLVPEFGQSTDSQNQYVAFLVDKSNETLNSLKKIVPIQGAIYSFKQGVAVGEKIAIDSASKLGHVSKKYTLSGLKRFLDDYNGIKLYRGNYRIGFLGNKESDWIKLQQFRTRGQQWYRFDLGNTVGYVSLTDNDQTKIQEISSRLDISQNDVSEAFKYFINLVFNHLFYDLNRKANDLLKVILTEDGKLLESLSSRVKKNDRVMRNLVEKNRSIQRRVSNLADHISKNVQIQGERVSMAADTYQYVTGEISIIEAAVKEEQIFHNETVELIREAEDQLKDIEIESYNNFKLMANGIITETITHELDSISKTSIMPNSSDHFDFLRDYFVKANSGAIYNKHVYPVKSSYESIAGKMQQVGNLYSFLETTFIRKGTYDEFVRQDIEGLVKNIEVNLFSASTIKNVNVQCDLNALTWLVPKGVMLHVFFNLFSNSLYWIDVRRKWAQSDARYGRSDDYISVETADDNEIIVYDTGTGVIKSMEDILFEPLQSGKMHNAGRGMGLYIVQKLMNSFGGNIELLSDRNQYGNRYRFLLTLHFMED